jgi:site-specific recombinase XerC
MQGFSSARAIGPIQSLREALIQDIMERADDAGDDMIYSACRRLSESNGLNWEKFHCPCDWRIVREMAQSLDDDGVLSDDIHQALAVL